jgi:chromosome segregation ATPase
MSIERSSALLNERNDPIDTGCSLHVMSLSETPGQPTTISDVLAELRMMRTEARSDRAESRSDVAELRSGIAELRSEMAEQRTQAATFHLAIDARLDSLERRLTTLFDEVAAFRNEYNNHTHE